jgi:hypothetical protein
MIKIRHLTLASLLLLILLFIISAANAASDWRTPTPNDLGKESAWRDKDPNRYLLVKADFDGDGEEDVARLLINHKDGKIGLFVTMGYRKKTIPLLLETIEGKAMIEVFGIEVVKPGTYITACGKGIWKCKKGEPEELHLRNPGIDFFKYESASSYFIWNARKKRFDRIWIDD